MKRFRTQVAMVRAAALISLLLAGNCLLAQTTAQGTINATLDHKNGIALIFNTDAAGVSLGNSGTSAASVNFGTISAFGNLAAGVSRPNYTLRANLAAAAPTGFTYLIDGISLTTTAQTVQTNGGYATDIPHNLDLTVLTAAPGAGGPAVGTPLSTTINFTATAN